MVLCFSRVRVGARPHGLRLWQVALTVSLALGPAGVTAGQIVPPRLLGRDLPVVKLPVGEDARKNPRPTENPTGQITMRDSVALALIQSPELTGYAWEVRARESAILQAARRPNPQLEAEVQDFGGSLPYVGEASVIQPQATIQLSQLIEMGGKRGARQRLAERTRDLAAWDYETARIDVLTRVVRAFVDVLASQQGVALTSQAVAILEQVQQTVQARVAAGVVSPIEQTKADVALSAARIDAARARRTLDADRHRLAALWGSSTARFESATGDLTVLVALPEFATLQERLSQNPDMARWAAEIAQREAALALAQAKRVPDVTLGGGYRRYTGIDASAFVVGGSIALPFFDRNRDGVREAGAQVSRALADQRAAETRALALLAGAFGTLAAARDEVSALTTTVLPGARSAFDSIQEGYRLGRFGLLEVLDAQRTLVGANAQYLRALSDFHKAAADVERLIGAPLSPAGSPAGAK